MTALDTGRPVGLIAAAGRFPIAIAVKARAAGVPLVTVGLRHLADPALRGLSHRFHWSGLAKIGRTIRLLRRAGVERFMLAGKVHKTEILKPWRYLALLPDWTTFKFWFNRRRRDNRDDSITYGILELFAAHGLRCEPPWDLCPELLVRQGVLTRRAPTPAEERDIEFGWSLAKEMGRLDVGQSVAVKDRAVLAVEAIEGTDRAIARAGELCGRGRFVVVKVAKPQQDMRFDVPTVGTDTIQTMYHAGARVLAIEAGKTILLDEAETLALADRYGIAITAR
jgi:UDP-2,3-diacylglucosamine hydrolase